MKTSIAIKRLPLIASGVALATCVLAVDRANAAPTLLNFEGVGNNQQVGNFYNGGPGGKFGVSFGTGARGFTSTSAGGSGNFTNLPSPITAIFFLSGVGRGVVMNVENGFKDGISFSYSANATNPPTKVRVFDGLNATGNILKEISLNNNAFIGCNPGPQSTFCNWDTIPSDTTGSFLGIAKSVDFSNVVNLVAFDNIEITLVSGTTVPEPTSVMGLIAISALGAGSVLQRKLLK